MLSGRMSPTGPASCAHAQPFAGHRLHRRCSAARQQRQRGHLAARAAQVQEAMTVAPVYASAWVAKAREEKILRRVFQDVKNLQIALTSPADPEEQAPSNGAGPDNELQNEVNNSFLGSIGHLELDEAGEASVEKEEYVVGKIAYGDEDNNQSEAGISEEDPADYQDAGSTSTGLQSMLSNPTLPLQTKMQVLTVLAKELGLKKLSINFLQLLIVESRIDALEAILESFETLYNQAINLQVARVRSAAPLDDEDKFAIAKIVQGRSGKRHVRVSVEQDDSLLAGFIVEFNYQTLDFSVKAAIRDAVERTAGALGVEVSA